MLDGRALLVSAGAAIFLATFQPPREAQQLRAAAVMPKTIAASGTHACTIISGGRVSCLGSEWSGPTRRADH